MPQPTTTTPSTTTTTSGGNAHQHRLEHELAHDADDLDADDDRAEAQQPWQSQQPSNHPAPARHGPGRGSNNSSKHKVNKKKKTAAKPSQPQRTPSGVADAVEPDLLVRAAGRRRRSACRTSSSTAFRIPPFLLPIYQAAGIQYDVPWQVLAAINEIETDYGRNLIVSTAGAVGWMQFLPSTWKRYGVDANGDGVADPYNPVDAIFAAARYLKAAGASTEHPPGDLRLQPRRLVRAVGAAAREADRRRCRPTWSAR